MQRFTILAAALFAAAPLAAHAAETITYSYDAKGRLIRAQRAGTVNNGVAATFEYDRANNRRRVRVTGAP